MPFELAGGVGRSALLPGDAGADAEEGSLAASAFLARLFLDGAADSAAVSAGRFSVVVAFCVPPAAAESASALLAFLERLFFVPASALESFSGAASALFLARLFFVPLSAAASAAGLSASAA